MSEHWYSLTETTKHVIRGEWVKVGFFAGLWLGFVVGNVVGLAVILLWVLGVGR